MEKILSDNAEALALITEALGRPKCRFDVDYEQGVFCELPHINGLLDVARLLSAKTYWELHYGSKDEATKYVTELLRFAALTRNHTTLIEHILSTVISEFGLAAAKELLASHKLSRGELESLLSLIREQYDPAGLAYSLKAERCSGISIIRYVAGDRRRLKLLRQAGLREPFGKQMPRGPLKFPLHPWRIYCLNDMSFYLGKMDEFIGAAGKPFPKALSLAESFEGRFVEDVRKRRIGHNVSFAIFPALTSAYGMEARFVALLRMAEIGVALEVFKDENGQCPKTLNELDLKNLADVRIDPFSGKDFIYQPEGRSYILYSIGTNRIDDGGQEVRDENGDVDRWKGDCIWRGPAGAPPDAP